jgi:hypothetical protein
MLMWFVASCEGCWEGVSLDVPFELCCCGKKEERGTSCRGGNIKIWWWCDRLARQIGAWTSRLTKKNSSHKFTLIFQSQRFYSVEVSLSLVAHLIMSDPQEIATDPCSIHGGTIVLLSLPMYRSMLAPEDDFLLSLARGYTDCRV